MNQIKHLFVSQKLASAITLAFLLFGFSCRTTAQNDKTVEGSKQINQSSSDSPSEKLSTGKACKGLDMSGAWTVTIEAEGTTPAELRTSKFRWEFTNLGDCKWNVKMSDLNGNHSVEKLFTTVVEGNQKFRFTNPEMTDMSGTYSQSQFSVAHNMHDVRWLYSGKRE